MPLHWLLPDCCLPLQAHARPHFILRRGFSKDKTGVSEDEKAMPIPMREEGVPMPD